MDTVHLEVQVSYEHDFPLLRGSRLMLTEGHSSLIIYRIVNVKCFVTAHSHPDANSPLFVAIMCEVLKLTICSCCFPFHISISLYNQLTMLALSTAVLAGSLALTAAQPCDPSSREYSGL